MFDNDNHFEHLTSLEARINAVLALSRRDRPDLNPALKTSFASPESWSEERQRWREEGQRLSAEIKKARIENSRLLDQLEARDRRCDRASDTL